MIKVLFVCHGSTLSKPGNAWLNSDKELIYLSTVS